MAFKNFSMWKGRLPHWRADDVIYYVTFTHRRELNNEECQEVYLRLMKAPGFEQLILCVLPAATEIMFRYPSGGEFSDAFEKAKSKAGKYIIKKSEERWSPLGTESYDRIVRDEAEFEERWAQIFESCAELESEDGDEYPWFWCDATAAEKVASPLGGDL